MYGLFLSHDSCLALLEQRLNDLFGILRVMSVTFKSSIRIGNFITSIH